MKDDPIMAEVRAVREELAKEADYNIDRRYDILKKTEEKMNKGALLKTV